MSSSISRTLPVLLAADEDVAVEQERQPAEHVLLCDGRMIADEGPDALGEMRYCR